MSGALWVPLQGRRVEPFNSLQQYFNAQKTQADVGYTKAQTELTDASTVKQQIENELGRLGYTYSRYGFDKGLGSQGTTLPTFGKLPPPPEPVTEPTQQSQQPNFEGGYGDEPEPQQQGANPPRQQQSEALPLPPIPPGYTPPGQTRQAMGSDGNTYTVPSSPNPLQQMRPAQVAGFPSPGQITAQAQQQPPIPPGLMQQAAQTATPAAAPVANQQATQTAPAPPEAPEGVIPDPAPGAGPRNPWSGLDPNGTSPAGLYIPGQGAASLPIGLAAAAARDPKSQNDALAQRRVVLQQLVGEATDLPSWNRSVAAAWRLGWINNGEAQHFWNHPSYKKPLLSSFASPEAQLDYAARGLAQGLSIEPRSGGFVPSPTAAAGRTLMRGAEAQFDLHTIDVPNGDGTYQTVQVQGGPNYLRFMQQHAGARDATTQSVHFDPRDATFLPALQSIPPEYREMAIDAAQTANIPLSMLASTINVESGWNPGKVGSKREVGLGQILPSTAPYILAGPNQRAYTLDELKDPRNNLTASAAYLRAMLDRSGGNIGLAAARYNGVNNPQYLNDWLNDYKRFGGFIIPAGAPVGGGGGQPGSPGAIPGPTKLSAPNEKRYEEGNALIPKDAEEVNSRLKQMKDSLGQQMQMQVLEPLIDEANPGAFGRARGAAENFLKTFMPEGSEKTWLGKFTNAVTGIDPSKASAMQELAKITLSIAGSAGEQVAGKNTGLGIVQLYQSAFPGPETQADAFKNMLHLFEVAHQAQIDYSDQSNDHFINARHEFGTANGAKVYRGLNEFDSNWQKQSGIHAPRVYVAAAAILNGVPEDDWTKTLETRDQRVEAIRIAMRANPLGTRAYIGPDGQKQLIPLRPQ